MSQGMQRGIAGVRLMIGIVFIVSALLKAAEITGFATLISLYGIVKEPTLVLALAWVIVLAEAALGGLALAGIRLRGATQALILLMLGGFTAVFAYGLIARGITDCGCFGSKVKLSPMVSIAKNIVLMLFSAFVLWGEFKLPAALNRLIPRVALALLPVIASAVLMFQAGAEDSGASPARATLAVADSGQVTPAATPPAEDPARPFAQFRFDAEGKTYDLGQGRWFVPFLSATCEHCKAAVAMLNDLPNMQPDLPPIVAMMMGTDEEIAAFRDETAPQFPTQRLPDLKFMQFMADAPPRYYFVVNGAETAHWDMDLPTDMQLVTAIYAEPPIDQAP